MISTVSWICRRKAFFIAVVTGCLAGCGREPAGPLPGGASNKPTVVATFSILGDFVRNIAGDRVELVVLVGPGSDVHSFEPSPSDGVNLARAVLLVENGLSLEPWLDKLYEASGSKAIRVVASRGVKLRRAVEGHRSDDHDHHHDHDGPSSHHDHGEVDPHFWNTPLAATTAVANIRDALISLDPDGAEVYRANASAFIDQLKALDAEVEQIVAQIPADRRKLVTTHDSLGYFADRYGFEIVGCVLASVTTEAADPSARHLADLIGRIKQSKTPVVFAEPPGNPRLIEQLARETGVRVVYDLYTCGLGAPSEPGGTYIGMIRSNARTIAQHLAR